MLFFLHILRVESWRRIENEMTLSTTTILLFIGRAFHNTFTCFCLFLYPNNTRKNLELLAILPPPHWAAPYSPIHMWMDRRILFRMDGREVQHIYIYVSGIIYFIFMISRMKGEEKKKKPSRHQSNTAIKTHIKQTIALLSSLLCHRENII